MRVLAVDTTTRRGSVALVEDRELLGEIRLTSADSHSRRVLPAVSFLLDGLGLGPGDVEGFAVTVGPGSFTGLRVGISTVQGLALAAARPCLGLPALDVLASMIAGSADSLVAMMDAYRDEVFAGVYDREARLLGPWCVAPPDEVVARVRGPAAFIGDGAERYRAQIVERHRDAAFPARDLFLAGELGRLAAPRLATGEGIAPDALRPLYLREAQIRKPGP